MTARSLKALVLFIALTGCLNFLVAHAEELGYHSAQMRDPFEPLTGNAKISAVEDMAIEEVFVEGIGRDENADPFVVLNGEPYQKGESFGGWFIQNIRPNGVLVSKDEETYFLDFEAERPKQDATDPSRQSTSPAAGMPKLPTGGPAMPSMPKPPSGGGGASLPAELQKALQSK